MPVDITAFQPIGGTAKNGSAPQMWSYKTTDAIATVAAADYFNAVRHSLNIGDLIYVVVTSGGALSTASLLVVKDKSSTAVDTTDATALTVTDAG